jgi:RNA polymerase sigma-70 factor (ECF subfamily)
VTEEETDQNLVKRAQNGDSDAFRLLVERYQRKVFSIAFNVVRDREDAMDLAQDAFVKAFKSLDSFKGEASFYTWIYRIVVNLGIDHTRKSRRYKTVDYDDTLKRDDVAGDGSILPSRLGTNPSKVLGRKELLDQMERALDTLSPNHREAIFLREIEGLSYEQMAVVMNVSKGTIMSRLHHARKNMQAALAPYMDGTMETE